MKQGPVRHLVFLAGDQLNTRFLQECHFDPSKDCLVMIESLNESIRQRQHKTKISYFFICMRRFAASLPGDIFLIYKKLSKTPLPQELSKITEQVAPQKVVLFRPGEERFLKECLEALSDYQTELLENPMFLCTTDEFASWAGTKKQLRMEYFYREQRRKFEVLINEDGSPVGGKWNYDNQNRKPYRGHPPTPTPDLFELSPEENSLLNEVDQLFPESFGENLPHLYPLDEKTTRARWQVFLKETLSNFGPYQDAMKEGEAFLFHSLISAPLNLGLIHPLELIQDVEKAYLDGQVDLNSAEGFIRQVMGWREFVRGIYWTKMPDYKELNFLNAKIPLPQVFWKADSGLNCFDQTVGQIKKYAYAHHIQRLMILGNFALLCGLDVKEVCEWYLEVYIDAIEWVELPNTLGMALHADHGFLGSKPYAASANYISKMSDYCKGCKYNPKTKTDEDSCPFNFLYWDFFKRHQDKFRSNHRLSMVYRNLNRMAPETLYQIEAKATSFLENLKEN